MVEVPNEAASINHHDQSGHMKTEGLDQSTLNGTSKPSTENNALNLAQMRSVFGTRLRNLITQFELTTLHSANLWILNDVLVPLNTFSNHLPETKSGDLKLKYTEPESYSSLHVSSPPANIDTPYPPIKGHMDRLFEFACDSEHISTPLRFKTNYSLNRINVHVHTYFAYNQQATLAMPLIVFPRNESLDHTLAGNPIVKTVHVERSLTGDLNNLSMFINWIKKFAAQLKQIQSTQQKKPSPNIIMLNSYIYIKLSNLTSTLDQYEELTNLLISENLILLVYPVACARDQINAGLFRCLCDAWKSTVLSYASKENPNNDLSFIIMYRQCLRRVVQQHKQFVRDSFNQLIRLYELPMELFQDPNLPAATATSEALSVNGHGSGNAASHAENGAASATASLLANGHFMMDDDDLDGNSGSNGGAVDELERVEKRNEIKLSDLSEQEIEEYANWVDEMSRIGSFAIKHTFLRDLYLKCKIKAYD
jgi:hypothetical protein